MTIGKFNMKIEENIPLAQYTTFKIGGPARFFFVAENQTELTEALSFAKEQGVPFFVLGGGSNLLVSDTGYSGLVIKMENKGIKYEGDVVTASSGEVWDEFVADTVSHGFHGLENLSVIPGTVGAVPVQNIGAYGTDVSNTIQSVRAFDVQRSEVVELSNVDCHFGYRDSLFKHQKGRYVILDVSFKLERGGKVNTEYKDLKEYFNKKNIQDPSISDVREAVIAVRRNKLPDWKKFGTAGSFFKNPIIALQAFNELKEKYPELPGFPEASDKEMVKVPLGWILDKVCNIKGFSVGKAQVYEKQALVVVATAGATSEDVRGLSKKIKDIVKEKTGISIEPEVEAVG